MLRALFLLNINVELRGAELQNQTVTSIVAFGKNPSGESKAILERDNIILALEVTGWKVAGETGAAQLLDINPSTLASQMKALGIKRPR